MEIFLKQAPIEARGEGKGALDRARKLAHRARELAEELNRPDLEAQAATALAIILSSYDTEETSRKSIFYAEQALAHHRGKGNISTSLWRWNHGRKRAM